MERRQRVPAVPHCGGAPMTPYRRKILESVERARHPKESWAPHGAAEYAAVRWLAEHGLVRCTEVWLSCHECAEPHDVLGYVVTPAGIAALELLK